MKNIPKKGIAALKAYFKEDFISGFSVSLIALPLCLGIALASGVPPLAGIVTAIIGGIVGSRIAGSYVTISGPAAGLIVITLGAAESMGGAGAASGFAGYPHALGAIVIGGLIMALFGVLKVGKVGDYFPSAAVHGMLAAIGVIIIIKQVFPAIGAKGPKGEILEVASEIPHYLIHELNMNAVVISLVALLILIVHPIIKSKIIKIIPAPMWVLIFTIPLAFYLGHDSLDMVNLDGGLLGEAHGNLALPSFAKIGESAFWVAVVGVALVSAIESLLSAKAVDTLDPYKRKSNLDQDLIAMGAGSSLAAALGGLPMISEIVRSSANVNNGAKTQWANFYHGLMLLIYVLIGVTVIEMIPVAALSAMLVFTGYKLAHPREFKHMAEIGKTEIIVFVATLLAVLATDLIIGIVVGIIVTYIFILAKGNPFGNLFKAKGIVNGSTIKLEGYLTFSNFLSLKKKLDNLTNENDKITLDFENVDFVDHTVIHHLEDYERNAKLAGKDIEILYLDNLVPESNHELSARSNKGKAKSETSNLSDRVIKRKSLAQQNNYTFFNKVEDFDAWQFYNLTIRRRIRAIENIIHIKTNKEVIDVADITVQIGAQTMTDIEQTTIARISGIGNLPRFFMHKTGLTDRIKESLGDEDINFENNPTFSKKYVLRSDNDEAAVRKFFTDELLEFFNSLDKAFFVSNGKDLAFYTKESLLNESETEELIELSKKLIEILNK